MERGVNYDHTFSNSLHPLKSHQQQITIQYQSFGALSYYSEKKY